jgi:hypothetical protein
VLNNYSQRPSNELGVYQETAQSPSNAHNFSDMEDIMSGRQDSYNDVYRQLSTNPNTLRGEERQ